MTGYRGRIPLNCVDKAMLAFHTKNEFMQFHFILDVTGTIEPARLRLALIAATDRHPTLRATIQVGLLDQTRMIQDITKHDPLTLIELIGPMVGSAYDSGQYYTRYQEYLTQWVNTPIDPTKELPWRVLMLRRSETDSSLVFTFHHSAIDGLGALRFIDEVLEKYSIGIKQQQLPLERGAARGDELITLAQVNKARVRHFYLKIIASLWYRLVIAPLSPASRIYRSTSRPSPAAYFCHRTLTPYEVEQIRVEAKTSGATMNDVLLAAGFKTFEQWNAIHRKPSRKISIMVPVDVGRYASLPTQGNRVSFISVCMARHERSDLKKLLHGVHRKTSQMLKEGTAFSIVYIAYLCSRLPPPVARAIAQLILATRVYLDSMLITNLGVIRSEGNSSVKVSNRGDATVTGIMVVPPVVSPMGISLSAITYNGHLQLTLAYKTSHFTHTEAELLMDLFVNQLRNYQKMAVEYG